MEISVKEKLLRRDIWQVYEDYQDRSENGEWFVVAPAGSFLKQVRESNLEGGRQLVEYRPRDPMEDVKLTYAPLQERYLVGDLANLADEPITPQVVIGWAEENGLLGCSWEEDIVEVEGTTGERTKYQGWGRRESVKRFEEAAREVRACLRMYEAASREGPVNLDELSMSLGPLPLTFREVLQPWKRHKTVERPWLYDVNGTMVQMRLRDHCFPKLVTFTRGGNPSGRFGLGYGFNSLLGAIWLLMAQLLDSQNVTYCRLPDCGRIIDFMPVNNCHPTRQKERVRATRPERTRSSAIARSAPVGRTTGTAKRRDGLATPSAWGSARRQSAAHRHPLKAHLLCAITKDTRDRTLNAEVSCAIIVKMSTEDQL